MPPGCKDTLTRSSSSGGPDLISVCALSQGLVFWHAALAGALHFGLREKRLSRILLVIKEPSPGLRAFHGSFLKTTVHEGICRLVSDDACSNICSRIGASSQDLYVVGLVKNALSKTCWEFGPSLRLGPCPSHWSFFSSAIHCRISIIVQNEGSFRSWMSIWASFWVLNIAGFIELSTMAPCFWLSALDGAWVFAFTLKFPLWSSVR